jgi:pimeloyl-ACP methyl ester carboxylesterase
MPRMKLHRALLVLTCLLATALPLRTRGETLAFSDCELRAPLGAGVVAARCAGVTVPENYTEQAGATLVLRVAVVKAAEPRAGAEPLFILAGGPGQAATEFYAAVAPAFGAIARHRDLVLIDQRGTGGSHRLACDFPDDLELGTPDLALIERLSGACLKALPARTEYYTTSVAVLDLDTVRERLKLPQLSLYGVSYGTRVAQQYLRHHGDRVRAVILDGAVPPDALLGASIPLDADRALRLLFQRCAGDTSCRAAFPRLAEDFALLRERLTKGPVRITLPHPATGAPLTLHFGAAELGATLRLLTYSAHTAAIVPLLLTEAAHGHLEPLAAQLVLFSTALDAALAYGMHNAVACTEDLPFITSVERASVAKSLLGTAQIEALDALCRPWPRGVLDEDLRQPLASAVPALILTGEADPVTPPAYAERTARGFRDALVQVLPGQGHGQLGEGCVPDLMARFLERGRAGGLDTSCLATLKPPAFFVDFAGPAP